MKGGENRSHPEFFCMRYGAVALFFFRNDGTQNIPFSITPVFLTFQRFLFKKSES